MDGGLLSLKWNNHRTTFFHVLTSVRKKNTYNDVTLACEGKFYQAHKLVLSTCSDYFERMFGETQCKHPVIVLKDIKSEELESLLDYMYLGEVNVVQDKLSGLIKAAECLRIKGLAVPDEEPSTSKQSSREKRTSDNSVSSEAKRRKAEESSSGGSSNKQTSNVNRSEERRRSGDSNKFRSNNVSNNSSNNSNAREDNNNKSLPTRDSPRLMDVKTEEQDDSNDPVTEVTIDETNDPVKQEPADLDAVYLSDSNSATDAKDLLMDNFGDGQQHFMDELLGQNSESDQGQMGEFVDTGDGSGAAGTSGQQHMVQLYPSVTSLQHPASVDPNSMLNLQFKNLLSTGGRIQSSPGESFVITPEMIAAAAAMTDASGSNSQLLMPTNEHKHVDSQLLQPRSEHDHVPPEGILPFSQLNFEEIMTPNKMFLCPVCRKEMRDKFYLRRHYMIHTGEKPFHCSFCSHKSKRREELQYHILRRHQISIQNRVQLPNVAEKTEQ